MEIHDKKQLAAICIERLKKEYPLSDCTLDYEHAWQLLVEVRLAAPVSYTHLTLPTILRV